jgi:hypothetical protein
VLTGAAYRVRNAKVGSSILLGSTKFLLKLLKFQLDLPRSVILYAPRYSKLPFMGTAKLPATGSKGAGKLGVSGRWYRVTCVNVSEGERSYAR